MRSGDEREMLAEELERLAGAGMLDFVSVWENAGPSLAGLYHPPAPHFEILLSGVLPLTLPSAGGSEERSLRPGEALYLTPKYGLLRRNDTDREMIVLNVHPEGVECYRSTHICRDGKASATRISYHSAIGIEQGGMRALQAFEWYAREGRKEMLRPLFRVFLLAARENILRDSGSANARAQFTYKMILQHMKEKCRCAISRKTVAAEFGLSPDYITHLFKRLHPEGFHAALAEMRMEQAAQFLEQSRLNVAQVSELCGFEGPSYFIKVFRRHYGMTPKDYRAKGK